MKRTSSSSTLTRGTRGKKQSPQKSTVSHKAPMRPEYTHFIALPIDKDRNAEAIQQLDALFPSDLKDNHHRVLMNKWHITLGMLSLPDLETLNRCLLLLQSVATDSGPPTVHELKISELRILKGSPGSFQIHIQTIHEVEYRVIDLRSVSCCRRHYSTCRYPTRFSSVHQYHPQIIV